MLAFFLLASLLHLSFDWEFWLKSYKHVSYVSLLVRYLGCVFFSLWVFWKCRNIVGERLLVQLYWSFMVKLDRCFFLIISILIMIFLDRTFSYFLILSCIAYISFLSSKLRLFLWLLWRFLLWLLLRLLLWLLLIFLFSVLVVFSFWVILLFLIVFAFYLLLSFTFARLFYVS